MMRVEFSPPQENAPLLVWMWTGNLAATPWRERLHDIAGAGFGGVVIRAGYAMTPDWGSDQWLEQLRVVLRESAALDLQVWLGDEGAGRLGTLNAQDGSARSGTDGHRIVRDWPELRQHFLGFASDDLSREFLMRPEMSGWKLPAPRGELLHAVAIPLVNRKLDFARSVTLTSHPPARHAQLIARLNCDVRVMMFVQQSAGYVDLLDVDAGYRFVQAVHEPLRVRLGDDWDKCCTAFGCKRRRCGPVMAKCSVCRGRHL